MKKFQGKTQKLLSFRARFQKIQIHQENKRKLTWILISPQNLKNTRRTKQSFGRFLSIFVDFCLQNHQCPSLEIQEKSHVKPKDQNKKSIKHQRHQEIHEEAAQPTVDSNNRTTIQTFSSKTSNNFNLQSTEKSPNYPKYLQNYPRKFLTSTPPPPFHPRNAFSFCSIINLRLIITIANPN
jgi:hypothetical protein